LVAPGATLPSFLQKPFLSSPVLEGKATFDLDPPLPRRQLSFTLVSWLVSHCTTTLEGSTVTVSVNNDGHLLQRSWSLPFDILASNGVNKGRHCLGSLLTWLNPKTVHHYRIRCQRP
jgi:hypothetical protein